MGVGFKEFVVFIVIILILNITGLWDMVMRGLRDLRGETPQEPPRTRSAVPDLDISFRLLGISPSSPWEEIERAFRQKAKIHHPDRGGDEDTMRALNEAYSLIKKSRGR